MASKKPRRARKDARKAKRGQGTSAKRKKRVERTRADLQALLEQPATEFTCFHVPEPPLLFGAGVPGPDPKAGITAHGPCRDPEEREPLNQIRLGIVGTGETIDLVTQWMERCRSGIRPDPGERVDPFLFPSFPGMAEPTGFGCDVVMPQALQELLSEKDVGRCLSATTRDDAVEAMVHAVRERLEVLSDRDKPPNIVIIALPTTVREKAGSGRRKPRRRRKKSSDRQMVLAFLDEKRPESASRTLHRVLKAEGMRYGLPTQLAWDTTFKGGAGVQDAGTRAWNFCTGLYYKAGGLPWRSTGLAAGTCYIGISFYRSIYDASRLHTSMAQAFSDRGEGFVLRGASFEWDRSLGPPQLSPEKGKQLVSDVVAHYRRHHRSGPSRVVVHKSAPFSTAELDGLQAGLGDVPFSDFLSVRRSSIRFLRVGNEPPLRGTVIRIDKQRYVVYTRGYVPYLKLYPGLRIPRPLEVTHARGGSSIRDLLTELFALTRMNWNSADFASAEPITLAFSRRVGLILSELPDDVTPQRSFRFYM